MIEEKGESETLDLSGRDLSRLDLSSRAIERELKRRGMTQDKRPAWVSPWTWGKELVGLNLRHANLQGADMKRINLHGADLAEADLRETDLKDACLEAASLYRARLQKARLHRANMRETSANEANFTGASLYRVEFRDSSLVGAKLNHALLDGANLSEATLSRLSIGPYILQEKPELLRSYLEWDDPGMTEEEWKRFFDYRLERAREIYIELKLSFARHGYYVDASWAYRKERKIEKATKAPSRARQYHGEVCPFGVERWPTYQALPRWHPLVWWFWFKYSAKWLLDWFVEISCGYGERPLRTLILAGVTLAVFPFIFWATGGVGEYSLALGKDIPSFSFIDYVIYSAGAFATIGYEGLKPINTAAQIWTAVEAMLGISILALLMFTLGNRISRS